MPNWVTNRVNAPQHVLEAMLSDDRQSIDFNKIATCDFPYDWDGYYIGAQYLASEAVGETLCVEQQSLEDRVAKLQDDELEQYHGMVENFKATGYLNFMKFARAVWGTKWNACRSDIDFIEQGQVMFDTAWSCPIGVFQHLSTKFPNDKITVEFADENIGYNCGTIKFLGGQIVFQNKAPSYVEWEEKEQRAQWIAFACDVQGYDYANYMKELEEDEQDDV